LITLGVSLGAEGFSDAEADNQIEEKRWSAYSLQRFAIDKWISCQLLS
jgi:hypothetical protein